MRLYILQVECTKADALDSAIYVYDAKSKQLWRGELPTSARSTPMTFCDKGGKQYLVVSAGGHGIPNMVPLGDYVVTFTVKE